MSADLKPDPVRLGSDPPPENSQSADSYEAPTRVGESAYVILARAMVDENGVAQPAATTATTRTTAPPPPPAASTPPAAAARGSEAPEREGEAAAAPSRAPVAVPPSPATRIEFTIAVVTFLAVAVPAVLYVIYLR